MEQRDNMHNGKLYDPNDDSVMEEQMVCLDRLYDFNQTRPSEMDKRNAIMKEMMGDVGKDCYIEPPFHANWGGKHVHFGDGVYANFGSHTVCRRKAVCGRSPHVPLRSYYSYMHALPYRSSGSCLPRSAHKIHSTVMPDG